MTEDSFHNYYEKLVLEYLVDVAERDATLTEDDLADVACVALNHLPPRYVRFDVDMSFYLSEQERAEIAQQTDDAVIDAIDFVKKNQQQTDPVDSGLSPTRSA